MGIDSCVKDMILVVSLDDAACGDGKVLLFSTTPWEHLAMLSKVDEILRAHLVPWKTFAVVHRITPVVEIEEVVLAILIEWYKVPSPCSPWFVKYMVHK
ncbi:hypothetical protein ES708_07449 [subsurface metagenome]